MQIDYFGRVLASLPYLMATLAPILLCAGVFVSVVEWIQISAP